jgi:hypothetical protein
MAMWSFRSTVIVGPDDVEARMGLWRIGGRVKGEREEGVGKRLQSLASGARPSIPFAVVLAVTHEPSPYGSKLVQAC